MRIRLKLSIIFIILQLFIAESIAQDNIKDTFIFLNKANWLKAQKMAKASNNKVLIKIVLSQKFLDTKCSSNNFEVVVNFLQNNPHWPQNNILKKIAEQYLNHKTSPTVICKWFNKNKPLTGNGYKFYALASSKLIKDPAKLLPIIRNGWIYGDFIQKEENQYYTNWRKHLQTEDHIRRINEHLWKSDILQAKRSMYLVNKCHQAVFTTQIAAIQQDRSTDKLFRQIPIKYYSTGLLFHYLKYKKQEIPDSKIVNLFSQLKRDKPHAHDLWRLQAYYVREFIRQKDFTSAYKILRKTLADQPEDISDQEFLAGWLALRFLHKPNTALSHFKRFYHIVKTPISISRGAYWLARTYDAKGEKDLAQKFYQEASKYSYTYYGQLAIIELKRNKIILPSTPKITNSHKQNIVNNEIVRAAKLLIKYGRLELAVLYIKAAVEQARNSALIFLIVDIIKNQSNNNPHYMIEIAKTAARKHLFIKNYSFPTPYKILNTPIETALTYSIIRQESDFNQYVVSSANAMGLMQLMDYTACDVAKSIGVKYNRTKLTTDPYYNIRFGTSYLKILLHKYNGSYLLAIPSYNAGSHNVEKWINLFGDPRKMQNIRQIVDWIELIPFYETRNYVQRVLENIQIYRLILNNNNLLKLKQDLLK